MQPAEATPATTPLPTVTGAEAVEAVNAFDAGELEDSNARLNAIVQADGDVLPDLAPLLRDADLETRTAAMYVAALLTDTQEEIEILRPSLQDPDLALRVMAAGSLAGVGIVESIPVLIEGLESSEFLPQRDPPRPVADLAREALEYYTGEGFASTQEWRTWWSTSGDTLAWDGERYVR